MQALTLVANTVTRIAAPGNRDFIHIFNDTGGVVYICYDSDEAIAQTGAGGVGPLATTNGIPIADQGMFIINNDGARNIFNRPVHALSVGGGVVRLQGVDKNNN